MSCALGPQRGGRTLPGVAAVEQQRARALGAHLLHQRREVREAADSCRSCARRCSKSRCVNACASRVFGAMPKCLSSASPTRCGGLPRASCDADVDVGFAEVGRQQLRVAVGEVEQGDVAARSPAGRRSASLALPLRRAPPASGKPCAAATASICRNSRRVRDMHAPRLSGSEKQAWLPRPRRLQGLRAGSFLVDTGTAGRSDTRPRG